VVENDATPSKSIAAWPDVVVEINVTTAARMNILIMFLS